MTRSSPLRSPNQPGPTRAQLGRMWAGVSVRRTCAAGALSTRRSSSLGPTDAPGASACLDPGLGVMASPVDAAVMADHIVNFALPSRCPESLSCPIQGFCGVYSTQPRVTGKTRKGLCRVIRRVSLISGVGRNMERGDGPVSKSWGVVCGRPCRARQRRGIVVHADESEPRSRADDIIGQCQIDCPARGSSPRPLHGRRRVRCRRSRRSRRVVRRGCRPAGGTRAAQGGGLSGNPRLCRGVRVGLATRSQTWDLP